MSPNNSNAAATFGWLAAVVGCASLLRTRQRMNNNTQQKSDSSSTSSHTLFQSSSFCDAAILSQLLDERYQTPLSAHKSACVERLGPCFMALARSVQSGASMAEALEQQTSMSPELRAFLAADLPGLAQAMRVIAESYLLRTKKGGAAQPAAASPLTYEASSGETLHKSVLGGGEATATVLSGVKSGSGSSPNTKKKKKDEEKVAIECDSGVTYHPTKFLAKGSAGEVFAAQRVGSKMMRVVGKAMTVNESKRKFLGAVRKQLDQQLVLKKVMPTQRSSALNEYRIGCVLLDSDEDKGGDDGAEEEEGGTGKGSDYCITYLDKAEQNGHLWLLLRRVTPSAFGVDLSEYIAAGFFANEAHQSHSRAIAMQLTQGLEHIANRNVIMRDVKSDNVLIESENLMDGTVAYSAKWSDYGLAVHLGDERCDGLGLRSPDALQQGRSSGSVGSSGVDVDPAEVHLEALIGFWYDTQKLVPKPKWAGRRPPERCFQDPETVHASSYDIYMLGIIFLCMVSGVDIPHVNKKEEREKYETVVRLGAKNLDGDYLDTLEMGDELRGAHGPAFRSLAKRTFGAEFGDKLMTLTEKMLARDPRERPNPTECIAAMA